MQIAVTSRASYKNISLGGKELKIRNPSKIFLGQILNTALMEHLQQTLGPLMTRTTSAAWKKLLDAIVVVVKNEVQRLEGQ